MNRRTFGMTLLPLTLRPTPAYAQDDVQPAPVYLTSYYARRDLIYGMAPNPKNLNGLVSYGVDGKPKMKYGWVPRAEPGVLCRWRVMFDAVWISSMKGGVENEIRRFPLAELRYYDPADPDGMKKLAKDVTGDPERTVHPHHWSVMPVTEVWQAQPNRGFGIPAPESFLNFDVLPLSIDRCRLFVQVGSEMMTWTGNADKLEPRFVNFAVGYTKEEQFDAGFTDQFTVFPHGDDYLFLTAGGQLHLADRSAGGFRTTRPVWTSKTAPIQLVVTDVDSGTVGLFTTPPRGNLPTGPFFTLNKGKVTQRFITEALGEYPDGLADPKLALELLGKYVRPKK